MLTIILYHYFLAHGIQYSIHYFIHTQNCPRFLSQEHSLHHGKPYKITWYGNPTVEKDLVGIYSVAFTCYVAHIFLFYQNPFVHLVVFSVIAFSFLTFHGLCHCISKEVQENIPVLNVLFFHHYKHHIIKSKNFGFGDLTYDYLFGTLDLEPIRLHKNAIDDFDSRYFNYPLYVPDN